jgi:hypothetical protein
MRDVRFFEHLSDDAIPQPPIERRRQNLRVTPRAGQPGVFGHRMQSVHQRAPGAEAAAARHHGEPPHLPGFLQIDSAGTYRDAVVEREDVHTRSVAVIEFDIGGHVLLIDEHRKPHAADGLIVYLEVGDAH